VRYAPYSPITQMLVNTDILHPDNDPLPPRANNGAPPSPLTQQPVPRLLFE